jgi:hypothetical protein
MLADHELADLPKLEESGFNLTGVLAAERYDALVAPAWRSVELLPGARSALVLGCGGPEFFRAVRRSPEWGGRDPVDRFARRWVEAARDAWLAAGWATKCFFYFDRRGDVFADFAQLANASGLGAPSRLRILLNPRYGPWWSRRAPQPAWPTMSSC